jgi:hypothetical protein
MSHTLFEWDAAKNLSNIDKHGLSFETARRIFERPILSVVDDRVDYREVREISIGRIDEAVILCVAHTDRKGVRRIISARVASRAERRRFENAERENII